MFKNRKTIKVSVLTPNLQLKVKSVKSPHWDSRSTLKSETELSL